MKLIGIIFSMLLFLPNIIFAENQIEEKVLSEGVNAIKNALRDPDSAKIKNTSVKYHDEFKTYIVCAEVNSKNAYGGYTGFQPIYAFFQTRTNTIDVGTMRRGDILWNDFCLE